MAESALARAVLERPGTLQLPLNLPYQERFYELGGSVRRQPSGHLALYGANGRRILYVDPGGQPLHECEWQSGPDGGERLLRARVWLEWDQWIGLVPSGLVNATTLDLSTKPGWQRLRPDDLRRLAAGAMGLPLSEVQFFYADHDLQIDAKGHATIRHRKDAMYVLPHGRFEEAQFMACMGAMHWQDIDFLPVVELFQSLLPGTGSAMLELIRELYGDQHPLGDRPLRYRGIPTYPSEAAFGLFSGFFSAQGPAGSSAFELFMDPPRSHQVIWKPNLEPLRRYTDGTQGLCITVKGRELCKATLRHDATGQSYARCRPDAVPSLGRCASVRGGALWLHDGDRQQQASLPAAWGPLSDTEQPTGSQVGPSWQAAFSDGLPVVEPAAAFGAVLLYPKDEHEISEIASQPFVADYLQDLAEEDPGRAGALRRARSVLIHNFDSALTTLIPLDRQSPTQVLYRHPAFAQRQVQQLWLAAARRQAWEAFGAIRLQPAADKAEALYRQSFDVIYDWMVSEPNSQSIPLEAQAQRVGQALTHGGVACVVGPASLGSVWSRAGLRVLAVEAVASLPTFRMHRSLIPQARVREDLTLFQLIRT